MGERSSETFAIEAAEPVIMQDVAKEDRFEVPDFMKKAGVVALANVPIFVPGQRPYGILQVDDTNPREYGDDEIQFLRTYAMILGPVVDRLHLVEQRARAEAARRESEEKYRGLFECIDEGFCVIELIYDEAGNVCDALHLEANPAHARHSGVADIVGTRMLDFIPAAEARDWLAFYDRVARTGRSGRMESEMPAIGRWVAVFASRVGGAGSAKVAVVFNDISERRLAEVELRESGERQAFLLKLSDALRAEPNADAAGYRAITMILEQLKLDRCYLATYRLADDRADITHQVGTKGVPAMPAEIRLSDFPEAFREVFDRTAVVDDVAQTEGLSETDRQNMAALGFGAFAASTLRRGEKNPLWALVAVSARPKRWSAGEIALLEEASERTWAAMERAGSEAALRESEERFQQFATASAAALWMREAATLEMEFVSPSATTIYGVEPDALLGDVKKWAALIVPDDRPLALEYLEAARRGETAVHEFRVQRPSDGAFRWIRNTVFPLRDGQDIHRVGGIAEDITEARQLMDHQGILLAELQHRVRNIMGMIRSMANRTAPGAETIEDYRSLLEGRLLALARVQALLTRQANAGGSLRAIVQEEVAAQAHHGGQFELIGPDIMLAPKAVEVLTLAFHELATNALKYGALSLPEGRLTVSWTPFEKRARSWLAVDWVEEGAPAREPSDRKGFGSELIEARIPYELGGSGKITIEPGGARCRMEFPLQQAESILETDAPLPTTVFGGVLDMTGAADLTGRKVLVVEDDYYMACDTAAALVGAGAAVLGPCPSEEATFDLLEDEKPTHAVLV